MEISSAGPARSRSAWPPTQRNAVAALLAVATERYPGNGSLLDMRAQVEDWARGQED